ncbi:hypothetical protein ABIF07_002312 [Bradyrhizobium elkanii]
MDHVASVAEHLHLDMPRAFDQLFDVKSAVAKGRERLGLCLRHQVLKLLRRPRDADAASATSGGGLDHHGEAGFLDQREGRFRRLQPPLAAGDGRHAGRGGGLACRNLVAHQPDRSRGRADKDQSRRFDSGGELGVLGQEAVAGMDGVGASAPRRGEDGRLVEIGFRRLRRADIDRFVGEPDRKRVLIGLAVDLHGCNAEIARRANDAHRDLAAIGYEELLDRHGWSESPKRRFRRSAGRPSRHLHSRPGSGRSCRRCRLSLR